MKENTNEPGPAVPKWEELIQRLNNLEDRISRIEKQLNLVSPPVSKTTQAQEPVAETAQDQKEMELEFRIGQFWLTRLGVIALTLGLMFLLTLPVPGVPSFFPYLIGFIFVVGMLITSYTIQKNYRFISRTLVGGAQVLLFFTVLRLHYFSTTPLVSSEFLALIFLIMVLVFNFILSTRLHSQPMVALNFVLSYFTFLLSQHPWFIFIGFATLALIGVRYYLKFTWQSIFIFSLIVTYFSHLLWLVGNPLITHTFQIVRDIPSNIYFIIIYFIIFTIGLLFRKNRQTEDPVFISAVFLNCSASYILYFLATITAAAGKLFLPHFFIFLLFLNFSIIFWQRDNSKYATFFYSIFGYIALTVALVAKFKIPDAFIWLSWQSLLVVITALWFRSKFIVVSNFFIFLIILLAFLKLAGKITIVSLSFGIVALLSARIMNWQKHRLELKTEMIRNAYLTIAFFIFPYALYHSLPREYVPFSWIGIAGLYFFMSLLLNNMKYRWMALLTLFLTAFYLAILGTTHLSPVFRVASFLGLGIALLIVSIIYTKARNKKQAQLKQDLDTDEKV